MINEFVSKIIKIKRLPFDILIIRLERPKDFEFKSGQYISINIPSKGGIVRRPYSIASHTFKDYLELCVRKIQGGKGSEYLSKLKEGDEIKFFGPFGRFNYKGNKDDDVIFIAPGVSIAPVKSIIENLLEKGHKGKLILIRGARNEEDLPYEEKFKELKLKHENFEYYNILSRPKQKDFENKGHAQKFILKFLPENFFGDIYICGFFEMIEEIIKILENKGISKENVFNEGHFRYASKFEN